MAARNFRSRDNSIPLLKKEKFSKIKIYIPNRLSICLDWRGIIECKKQNVARKKEKSVFIDAIRPSFLLECSETKSLSLRKTDTIKTLPKRILPTCKLNLNRISSRELLYQPLYILYVYISA